MKRLLMTLSALVLLSSAHAQILNSGFENWDSAFAEYYPTDWPLLNSWQLERTTDAFSGNYALEVSVWYYYTETRAEQAAPINFRPVAFCGWYKYTDNIIQNQTTNLVTDDTAFAEVYLTRWNTAAHVTDTVGRGRIELLGATSYRHFSCPVTYTSADMPDTVTVVMDPSMMRNGGNYFSTSSMGYNSYLKMDDLYLQRWATSVPDVAKNDVKLCPNPAGDHLDIAIAEAPAVCTLTDITGKVVLTQAVSGNSHRISLQGLAPGPYVISVTNQETQSTATQTFIHQ